MKLTQFFKKRPKVDWKLTFLCLNQLLQIVNQISKFLNGKVFVTRTIMMLRRPQFKIFKSVIGFNPIFMMNCFSWKQISSQMSFHNQTMLRNIAILCPRMVRTTNHNITPHFYTPTLPSSTSRTSKIFLYTFPSITCSAITSKSACLQGITNSVYTYLFNRMTYWAFTLNRHISLAVAEFHSLRGKVKHTSELLRHFTKFKWSPLCQVNFHSMNIIPYGLIPVNISSAQYSNWQDRKEIYEADAIF